MINNVRNQTKLSNMKKLLLILCFFPILAICQTYTPGQSYFDANNYVEYIAGNLPIVLSAPHGGDLEPTSIPDRSCSGCVYVKDSYTQELAREMQAAFFQKTGCYPHVVINLLHRKKFDANRDIGDAADGNPTVEASWNAYHDFLDSAKAQIEKDYGRGLFLDLHGHGHTIQRIELGYLITRSELQMSDNDLNTLNYVNKSSIKKLTSDNLNVLMHSELLRGNLAFGTLLENRGFPAVPSKQDPFPIGSEPFFSGGYNTQRHGSRDGGDIDGIQIECNQSIRFTTSIRQDFADSIAQSVIDYYDIHYNAQFIGNYCNLISNAERVKSTPDFRIYPNPVQEYLQLEIAIGKADIMIFNSIGQTVKQLKWNGLPLDVRDLNDGIYFLQVLKDGEVLGSTTFIKTMN